jgi:hypothetical protein
MQHALNRCAISRLERLQLALFLSMTTLTPFRIHDENHGLDVFQSASKSTRKKPLGAATGPRKQGAKTGCVCLPPVLCSDSIRVCQTTRDD